VKVSARVRDVPFSGVTAIASVDLNGQPLARRVRLSQIIKACECEQVAAVCYRVRRGAVEFLLVKTRGSGRWIFPKGSAEPGLTHAQAAAIEAFEEAGVHGRIEEAAFVRYMLRGQGKRLKIARSAARPSLVSAHLCEVRRLCDPKESNRNPTWFSMEDTIRRLRYRRRNEDGEEFARVVQRAVARIERLRRATYADTDRHRRNQRQDGLHKIQFEAPPLTHRPLGRARGFTVPASPAHGREILPCEVLPFDARQHSARRAGLLSGGMNVKVLGPGAKNG
jgi:8-oxo-dGTP pyrophosphatase MutT (NUDIX family)